MSTLVGEEDAETRRIKELKQQLHEAQMRTAVGDKAGVMNTVATEGTKDNVKLGPTVLAEVKVNGIPTRTLVDTGSPATIVSLDFVLDVLAIEKGRQQTPEQWKEEKLKRFSPPEVSLKAYGGHELDILSQIDLRLSQGKWSVDVPVLVQQGAPNDLLLGTDVQPKLGFALVVETAEKLVDLLSGEECLGEGQLGQDSQMSGENTLNADLPLVRHMPSSPQDRRSCDRIPRTDEGAPSCYPKRQTLRHSSAGGASNFQSEGEFPQDEQQCDHFKDPRDQQLSHAGLESGSGLTESDEEGMDSVDGATVGVVLLLKGEKLPAGHRKMVQAKIHGAVDAALLLFTPALTREDLSLADAVLDVTNGPCTTLVVQNGGLEAVCLEAGTPLGTVVPAVEVKPEVGNLEEGMVGEVMQESMCGESGIGGDGDQVCALVAAETDSYRRERLLQQLELQLAHLTPLQCSQLEDHLMSYANIFALDDSELGVTTLAHHSINTGDHAPVPQSARHMPFSLRADVDNLVGKMLAQGVIVPSTSPWSSPVVLVRKKDGGMRFCVDIESSIVSRS